MVNKENDTVEFSARVPKNINNAIKNYAKTIGISKNSVLLLALKDYAKREGLKC